MKQLQKKKNSNMSFVYKFLWQWKGINRIMFEILNGTFPLNLCGNQFILTLEIYKILSIAHIVLLVYSAKKLCCQQTP